MGQLQTIAGDLEKLGYQIIAISPDRPEKLKESLGKNKVEYLLLSDSGMEAALALGVAFKVDDDTLEIYKKYNIDLEQASGRDHHLLPVPSVFVFDKKAKVRFTYVNPDYRIRIDPAVLLAAAKVAAE